MVGGSVYFWIKEFYVNQTKLSLLHNIELISYMIKIDQDLDKIAFDIKENLNLRLTIINSDGVVIAESHENKQTMENHRYRQEVLQADKDQYGFMIRHSNTINKDLIYVVKKFEIENKTYYIRLAKELEKILFQIKNLGAAVFVIVLIFFLAIIFTAFKINNQTQQEISKIMQFLYDLTKKKKNSYITSEYSHEFNQITRYLSKISKVLAKQNKQKDKYTAKLKSSNSQKDDIITAISHEFKNPISVINGYSQTLIEDENINPNIRKKFLEKIHINGTRLTKLIDTLRLSIRLDEKKQTITYTNVNLYNLSIEVKELLSETYKNRTITITGQENTTILADEMLLTIAVTNLVENALKYSEDTVHIKFTKLFFAVEDQGIGIAEKELKKITDKFYRVSSNTWNNSLGLGLSITTNIIQLHNFKLQIKSVHNQGSTFTIIF